MRRLRSRSLAFLVLLVAQSDLVLPALQLARLFVVFVLRNSPNFQFLLTVCLPEPA